MARPSVAACLGILVAGCTYTGAATGPGIATFQTPGIIPPAFVVVGPPIVGAPAASAEKPAPHDGAYAGIAHVLDDPGGACSSLTGETSSVPPSNFFSFQGPDGGIRVSNFVVRGDSVSLGRFSGTIRPDGGLTMQAGSYYVLGRFIGPEFVGRFWQPRPGCTYTMVLQPVA